MSKALVKAITGVTHDQFRTDWSLFMKQCIEMNRMTCPALLTLKKSDNKLNIIPAMPKAMVEKPGASGVIYLGVFVKNNDNAWEGFVFAPELQDFTVDSAVKPGEWLEPGDASAVTITGSKYTAGTVYDVLIVFSDQEITVETAENSWDRPYSVKGASCEFIHQVTAQA